MHVRALLTPTRSHESGMFWWNLAFRHPIRLPLSPSIPHHRTEAFIVSFVQLPTDLVVGRGKVWGMPACFLEAKNSSTHLTWMEVLFISHELVEYQAPCC